MNSFEKPNSSEEDYPLIADEEFQDMEHRAKLLLEPSNGNDVRRMAIDVIRLIKLAKPPRYFWCNECRTYCIDQPCTAHYEEKSKAVVL